MRIALGALQVWPGRSGSHEPYVSGILGGLGQIESSDEFDLYIQHREFEIPLAFRERRGTRVHVVAPNRPHRETRLLHEQRLAIALRPDAWLWTGSSIGAWSRTPQVAVMHADPRLQPGSYGRLQGTVASGMIRLMRRRASAVITPTAAYGHHLERAWGMPERLIRPVHHGVDDLDAISDPAVLGLGRHLVTVTNAKAHKNLLILIDAWMNASLQIPDLHLWLIGRVGDIEARVGSRDSSALSRLHVLNWLGHRDVMRHIAAADVLIFPSEQETFGMPLAEALAVGTPVVAADTEVAREVCGNTAVFVPPREIEALAQAIEQILKDEALAAHLQQSGVQRGQSYTWAAAATATVDILHAVSHRDRSSC